MVASPTTPGKPVIFLGVVLLQFCHCGSQNNALPPTQKKFTPIPGTVNKLGYMAKWN